MILHEVSATYDHTNPHLQRRMSRNAELIFWTRLPLALRLLAIVPHLGFLWAQLMHRLLTRRVRAFALGKLDACWMLLSGRAEDSRGSDAWNARSVRRAWHWATRRPTPFEDKVGATRRVSVNRR